jgi:hypothetical protein
MQVYQIKKSLRQIFQVNGKHNASKHIKYPPKVTIIIVKIVSIQLHPKHKIK